MRVGLDRKTGAVLTGWDECAQALNCIAQTAIASLVLNRAFGSDAPTLQDRPQNATSIGQYFAVLARAWAQWEPAFRLSRIRPVRAGADGVIAFDISGTFYPNGHLGDFSNPEGVATQIAPAGIIAVGA